MRGLRVEVGSAIAALLLGGCLRLGYEESRADGQRDDGGPDAGDTGDAGVDAGARAEAGVTEGGMDAAEIDPCSPEHLIDADGDGVCDRDDRCEGSDDSADRDEDGVPDGCDPRSCGNGRLDPGETCDPSSADAPCPESCPSASACEPQLMRGAAQACDAECVTMPITAVVHADGCCPQGANATNDSDCAPICGNQITEPGEACDGGSLCGSDCSLTPEGQCLQFAGTATDECKRCRCAQCTDAMLSCFSIESGFSEYWPPIVNCGDVARCFDNDCYCGTSTSCANPNGPCKAEIDAATQAEGAQANDCAPSRSCTSNRSTAIGTCEIEYCNSECVQ